MTKFNKKVVIMGASSGLGLEVARLLLAEGCRIGVAARRIDPLMELARQFPGRVEAMQIDIISDDSERRLEELIDKLGGVDLYLHSSGIGKVNAALDSGIEKNTLITNGLGFTRMIGVVFRYMSKNGGGHIAVISSIAGTKGLGPAPSYSATKAFQNIYVEALEQLSISKSFGIIFTDIRPGFVATDFIKGSNYPMTLDKTDVAKAIVRALSKHKRVVVIDWRWRVLVTLWKLIPRSVWCRLKLVH